MGTVKGKGLANLWLRRARSNLLLAKRGRVNKEVFYEDLCFNAQQAAEKAIKAVMIINNIPFPKTHFIDELLGLIEARGIRVTASIWSAADLVDYAVGTRYPGKVGAVRAREYRRAVRLAERVFSWAEKQLTKK